MAGIDKQPVRQQVVDQLKTAFFAGRYGPGAKLVERQLCEDLGVSRTALREGLRQLEAEGLVRILPNRGPEVVRLSRDEVRDLYEVRRELEGLIGARAAAAATQVDAAELNRLAEQVIGALNGRVPSAIVEAKSRFYAQLLVLADNDELSRLMGRYFNLFSLMWPAMIARQGADENEVLEIREIAAAVGAGDVAAARLACGRHMETASARLLASMAALGWE